MQQRLRLLRTVFVVALALCLSGGVRGTVAQEQDGLWHAVGESGAVELRLHFFWSLTCPHCAEARLHLNDLVSDLPWLAIESYEVTQSAENRRRFQEMATLTGDDILGVPTFFLCGRMIVGFDGPDGIGAELEDLAVACRAALADRGAVAAEAAVAAPVYRLPVLGAVDIGSLSLPLVTVVIGGLDAFNPCAFFILLFLLSLLVHARSRLRMALIGGIFVFFSGLIYFAFMAAWLNLFLVLEGVQVMTTIAGIIAVAIAAVNIKDFYAFKSGVSLSIPERAKPGLFARMRGLVSAESLPTLVAGTVALAIAANTYELLCTSGFPLVYTRILTLKDLSSLDYYLYLALYNSVYVLPLLAIVTVFTVTLGGRKLSEVQGRALKLLSGLMMLGLGMVLILAPDWLDNPMTAGLLLLLAVAGTALLLAAAHVWRRRHVDPAGIRR